MLYAADLNPAKVKLLGGNETHGRIQLVNFILGQYVECFIISGLE